MGVGMQGWGWGEVGVEQEFGWTKTKRKGSKNKRRQSGAMLKTARSWLRVNSPEVLAHVNQVHLRGRRLLMRVQRGQECCRGGSVTTASMDAKAESWALLSSSFSLLISFHLIMFDF